MKIAKISFLIAFLTHFLWILGQIQLSHNQCSGYFTYVTKPGITDILGQIEITPPTANDAFYLKVALNIATELPSQIIRLELAQTIKESVLHVHQGRPLLYYVYYPMNEQIPSLSAIWFNSQRYCPGPEVSDNITANVELGHILSSPNKEPIVYSFGPWQQISQPWDRNSSSYRIDNPTYDRLNHYSGLNNECGITSYYTDDTNRLIPDGETTLPGQWPWLVTIYKRDNEKYEFGCIGSILTTRHIVTHKWCVVYHFVTSTLLDPQKLLVFFGQLNSREWDGNHTGIINRTVANYTISEHPSKPQYLYSYDGLAILLLRTAVEYNAFIRPICLWSGSTNLQDTVNMTGYIVGWGLDLITSESGKNRVEMYTGEPRMAKVPLMNLSAHFTENTLQYYAYPYYCYTDLGGGLVVFNITTGSYQLRAVKVNCLDWDHIIVYVDVANLISWIQQQILLLT